MKRYTTRLLLVLAVSLLAGCEEECFNGSNGVVECKVVDGDDFVCNAIPGEFGTFDEGSCPNGMVCDEDDGSQGYCEKPPTPYVPTDPCAGCGGAFCAGKCSTCKVCL